MPRWRPVAMRPSANGSAEKPTTAAAKTNRAPTMARRCGAESAPIIAAGPTRSGSTDGERAAATAYPAKRAIKTTLSVREIRALNGRTNEYAVAAVRKSNPRMLPRSSRISRSPRTDQARRATIGQPTPGSNRFEPVMLATAYGAKLGSAPAFHASTTSTAYSGSTASSATTIRASARGISRSAASAPHDIAKAALTIPRLKTSVLTSDEADRRPARSNMTGMPATTMSPRAITDTPTRPTPLRGVVWAGGLAGQATMLAGKATANRRVC
jgi:hypothetical protein